MKKTARQIVILSISAALICFSGCSSSKKAAASTSASQGTTVSDAPATSSPDVKSTSSNIEWVGAWTFEVKGTPDGDVKGDMIISTEGNVLKGVIVAFGGQSEIQSLKIDQNLLSGIFYYNGMAINMSGTFNGNNYNGKVEAEGYSFPMTAAKK